jgi:hypothetical protein
MSVSLFASFPSRPSFVHYLNRALHTRKMSVRSYEDAINSLNTLQSNAAVLAAVRAAGPVLNPNAIKEMDEFVTRIGITV